jgi:hypothetical protein
MYHSLIIELNQIAPPFATRSAPCLLLTVALAPDLPCIALSTAGFMSSSDTAGKPQPQYHAPATILTASDRSTSHLIKVLDRCHLNVSVSDRTLIYWRLVDKGRLLDILSR